MKIAEERLKQSEQEMQNTEKKLIVARRHVTSMKAEVDACEKRYIAADAKHKNNMRRMDNIIPATDTATVDGANRM